jgi:CRISPR-associated protein Csb2
MIALGIRYLTGYVFATDAATRSRVEWPPHPGRLFMALVAAWHETKPQASDPEDARTNWVTEGEALRWLEKEPPPSLAASQDDRRSVVEVYVPPNDMASNKITVVPAYRTNRQPRTFPCTRPHDSDVYFLWPDSKPTESIRFALERLCDKVIRVGHSSSLVQAWIAGNDQAPPANWIPDDRRGGSSGMQLRVFGPGTLAYLDVQYRGKAIARFHELSAEIEASKGKAKKALETSFLEEFGIAWRKSLPPPEPMRPVLSLTKTYVKAGDVSRPVVESWFDSNLLVLAKHEGPNLGLESTWQLLTALRGAIESKCHPTPEWVSGHQSGGAPSDRPHLALLPLAFAGAEYADGHLLGAALAFPRGTTASERGRILGPLLYDASGSPAEIELTFGKLGVWKLRLEERSSPPRALQPETWTEPSKTWASVTPVVLDRHPKTDPSKDRVGWVTEITEIVASACERIGLPRPVEIDVDKTSWHRGAPRSKPGPDGFPLMPHKVGGPVRPQTHIWIRFDVAVRGPILLGAGRYRGYGFCKPWHRGVRL